MAQLRLQVKLQQLSSQIIIGLLVIYPNIDRVALASGTWEPQVLSVKLSSESDLGYILLSIVSVSGSASPKF